MPREKKYIKLINTFLTKSSRSDKNLLELRQGFFFHLTFGKWQILNLCLFVYSDSVNEANFKLNQKKSEQKPSVRFSPTTSTPLLKLAYLINLRAKKYMTWRYSILLLNNLLLVKARQPTKIYAIFKCVSDYITFFHTQHKKLTWSKNCKQIAL